MTDRKSESHNLGTPHSLSALPPPDLEAECARLDAELLADALRLNDMDEAEANLKIERVKVRIRFGTNLDRRLEITPHKQKGRYLRGAARRWGFKKRKAHDCRIFARLHQTDPRRWNFAHLAKMTVLEVRDEWRRLRGNQAAAGVGQHRRPTTQWTLSR
jgi:hypothetical protein